MGEMGTMRRLLGMGWRWGLSLSLPAFLGLLLTGGLACSEDRPTELHVPLQFSPSHTPDSVGSLTGSSAVFILPVNDQRDDKSKIGENRQERAVIPIYAAGDDPADFVHGCLMDQLKNDGMRMTGNPDDADRVISVTLRGFWAEESPDYHAQISADITVLDKAGKTLWAGTLAGTDSTWGGSLRANDYQQIISNAVVKAVSALASDDGFRAAVGAAPNAVPPPPAPPAPPSLPAQPSTPEQPEGQPTLPPPPPVTPPPSTPPTPPM